MLVLVETAATSAVAAMPVHGNGGSRPSVCPPLRGSEPTPPNPVIRWSQEQEISQQSSATAGRGLGRVGLTLELQASRGDG